MAEGIGSDARCVWWQEGRTLTTHARITLTDRDRRTMDHGRAEQLCVAWALVEEALAGDLTAPLKVSDKASAELRAGQRPGMTADQLRAYFRVMGMGA
jgi:hypothetical protein